MILNIKSETINPEKNFCDLRHKFFLYRIPIKCSIKEHVDKLDFFKSKNIYSSKDSMRMKLKHRLGENICKAYI